MRAACLRPSVPSPRPQKKKTQGSRSAFSPQYLAPLGLTSRNPPASPQFQSSGLPVESCPEMLSHLQPPMFLVLFPLREQRCKSACHELLCLLETVTGSLGVTQALSAVCAGVSGSFPHCLGFAVRWPLCALPPLQLPSGKPLGRRQCPFSQPAKTP